MKTPANQTAFASVPDKTNCTPTCSRFDRCNAPICPFDSDWNKRVMLAEDSTCFYLTESVKDGARTKFEGAGLKVIYEVMVIARREIIERHPRIRRNLERAKLTDSRMTRFSPKAKECVLDGGNHA